MRSTPISITCATSSAQPGATSRRSGGSATASPMAEAMTPQEAGLLRRVRVQLVLWSGGITLVLLIVLGVALYVAVDRSLSASGTAELVGEINRITRTPPGP